MTRTSLPVVPRGVRESLTIEELRLRPLPRRSPDELDRLRRLIRGNKVPRRAAK